jgi:putative ubiquitin-RnfH superfamily antitoxin RatB of RatAB toxin-antitoxin module
MAPVDRALPGLWVEVVYSPAARQVEIETLTVAQGTTLAQVLGQSSLWARCLQERAEGCAVRPGIWGRQRPLDTPLRDGDRVELYRPLALDPMQARRQRQARHNAAARAVQRRSAG